MGVGMHYRDLSAFCVAPIPVTLGMCHYEGSKSWEGVKT